MADWNRGLRISCTSAGITEETALKKWKKSLLLLLQGNKVIIPIDVKLFSFIGLDQPLSFAL
jgi:hypothetical protein